MTREDRNELITAQRITEAVTAVINETPTGAAGGMLYAALTAYLGLDQFEAMRALVAAKRMRAATVISRYAQRQARLRRTPLLLSATNSYHIMR
jgi:hypothetical protein